MPKFAGQPCQHSEMRASSVNYGRKLKLFLQRLRLNSVNLDYLRQADTGAMPQVQILQMLNVSTGGMCTIHLLTTAFGSFKIAFLTHLSLCSLATSYSQVQYPVLHEMTRMPLKTFMVLICQNRSLFQSEWRHGKLSVHSYRERRWIDSST